MNKPLVCICIPTYNNVKTLEETLKSLLNQTYQNIIIKIFDNASTDDSMTILKEYEAKHPNIKVFQNEINIGGEGNFNKCIEHMEGDYSAIFHSDDIYDKTIIEEQINIFLKDEETTAVFTNGNKIDNKSQIFSSFKIPKEFKDEKVITLSFQELYKAILKNRNFLITPTALVKTCHFRRIGVFRSNLFGVSSDLDVWLRLSQMGKICIINKNLIHYRVSENSYSVRVLGKSIEKSDLLKVLEFYNNTSGVRDVLIKLDYIYYDNIIITDEISVAWKKLKYFRYIDYMNIYSFSQLYKMIRYDRKNIKSLVMYILCFIKYIVSKK